MLPKKSAIVYFVKQPTPGKVKTRLAKSIGDKQAASHYQDLCSHNFEILKQASSDLLVFFDPPESRQAIESWLPHAQGYSPQKGESLGDRMSSAFQQVFEAGYQQAICVGSDTLQLDSEIIELGFKSLERQEVVLGPAKDGGYYLVGSSRCYPWIFEEIPWSTSEVLQTTLHKLQENQVSHYLLPSRYDLDDEHSLEIYLNQKKEFVS